MKQIKWAATPTFIIVRGEYGKQIRKIKTCN